MTRQWRSNGSFRETDHTDRLLKQNSITSPVSLIMLEDWESSDLYLDERSRSSGGYKASFQAPISSPIAVYSSSGPRYPSKLGSATLGFFCATRAQPNTSTHDPFIKKLVDVFRIENCSPRNPKTFYLFVGLFYICTLERPKRRIWGLEI
jgi:hypothetical protein